MRNPDLDKVLPIDSLRGEKQKDKDGRTFRMVNGKKIYQIQEKTQADKDLNLVIDRWRCRPKP